jgi:hypothetical protein
MQSPTLYIEGEPCLLSHQAIVKKFLLLAAIKEEEDLLHTITISKEDRATALEMPLVSATPNPFSMLTGENRGG